MNMNSKVPRIAFARPDITEQELRAVQGVMMSGNLTNGSRVGEFEEKFAEMVGAPHAVAVGSCTQGFMLLFDALDIQNRTVTGPTYTFTGPSTMAVKLGGTVALVDNAKGSFVPSVMDLARQANLEGGICMPMHFAGSAYDIKSLRKLVRPDIPIIADAAHALLSGPRDRYVGGLDGASATVFSFYTTKPLCTGFGGMITTHDAHLADELRSLRLHGIGRDLLTRSSGDLPYRYEVEQFGWKANMTDMAAAMGIVQLERLLEMQAARLDIAHEYTERLGNIPGVRVPYPPDTNPGHCYHLFPILVPSEKRDRIMHLLDTDGIGTSAHFIPLHQHRAWKMPEGEKEETFPNADAMFAAEISLPIYSLMEDEQVGRVCKAVENALWIERGTGPSASDTAA
jgi:dTDP-4-amino-4,6-dideoxygalactose transaminase